MDLKSLYQEILNEHNLNPTHKGVTEGASLTLQGVNPSCGDNIYLQLKIDENGIITDGSFNGSGCAVSQASVDMMLDRVKCAVLGWHTMQEMLGNGKSAGQGSVSHCEVKND